MLKVHSGPGRPIKEFLTWCHARGIIVHPGVQNTITVLQDMDQSYVGFKIGFYASLDSLLDPRLKTNNGSSQPHMGAADYGVLIFGKKGRNL